MTRLVADIVGSTFVFLCGLVTCWLWRRPSRTEQAALEQAERAAERAEKAEAKFDDCNKDRVRLQEALGDWEHWDTLEQDLAEAEYQLKLERMALEKSYRTEAALQLRVGDLEARAADGWSGHA